MLRLGIFIAALIGVFIAALSLMPRFLSPSAYRAQALVGLTRALGQPVTAGEDAAIVFLPRPKLQLTDVRVLGDGSATDEVLLSADTATFDLAGRALATGQIAVEAVVLDRAVIHVTRAADQSVTFGAAPLFSGLTGRDSAPSSLTNLRLLGGEIRYRDEPFGQDYRFDIEDLQVQRVNDYAFESRGSVRSQDERFEVAVSFVPNANPGGERGFNIEVRGEDASVLNLRGSVDEKFGQNLVIREDLDWKLTAEGVQHPLFDRLALADGQGVTLEARVLSDREGYDFQGLTLTRSSGEQMRGQVRFTPDESGGTLDLMLTGKGLSLSESAAELPLRDWTALLPGAVADLGGLSLNFDIAAQGVSLPNGEVMERLVTQGTLRESGLTLTSLKGNTAKGVALALNRLDLDGPDSLRFAGKLIADDAASFVPDSERAELIASLGRLTFDGAVEMIDGALQITEGTVNTAQGVFNVDGMPFSLDSAEGFGDTGIELVTDKLDLNAWTGSSDLSQSASLTDQGRAIAQRMKALGSRSLSLVAEQANLGGRILSDLEATFTANDEGTTAIEARFAEDDGTQFQTTGILSADGQSLESGQVSVTLNSDPRAAEKAIARFAPQAADNPLVADVLDRLTIDGLTVLRTDASSPWELALRSGDTEIGGSDLDAEGNRFWSFRSPGASDLFQTLDIPLSPLAEAGGVNLSGRQSGDELVGIGTVLGADITLQEHDAADGDAEQGRAFKLHIEHEDAQAFLAALGFDLPLPQNGPVDIELSVSRMEQNYGYRIDALLGADIRASGNGFYSHEGRTLEFDGTVNALDALPWLNALFLTDAEDSVLSPLLSALSGRVGLDVGQLGPLADARVDVQFTPGRYTLDGLSGTFAEGLLAGGALQASGDVLAGYDIFADLTVAVEDAAPTLSVATDTALAFESLSFQSESFQARGASMDSLLENLDASFTVNGEAQLSLSLTSINASESLDVGPWKDFLAVGEGISAYEDLRSLFFDGDAALEGVVQVREGVALTNTLALTGRQGTLLAKGALEIEPLSARGFVSGTPFRVELYRAEDSELVEQVLLLKGPLVAPEALSIGR